MSLIDFSWGSAVPNDFYGKCGFLPSFESTGVLGHNTFCPLSKAVEMKDLQLADHDCYASCPSEIQYGIGLLTGSTQWNMEIFWPLLVVSTVAVSLHTLPSLAQLSWVISLPAAVIIRHGRPLFWLICNSVQYTADESTAWQCRLPDVFMTTDCICPQHARRKQQKLWWLLLHTLRPPSCTNYLTYRFTTNFERVKE